MITDADIEREIRERDRIRNSTVHEKLSQLQTVDIDVIAEDRRTLLRLLDEARAHAESLQNKWASRPLDHPSGEALIAENDSLSSQLAAARRALEKIVKRWPSTSNPNCDDYERGYGQATADAAFIARAALAGEKP